LGPLPTGRHSNLGSFEASARCRAGRGVYRCHTQRPWVGPARLCVGRPACDSEWFLQAVQAAGEGPDIW